jgi:predicted RNase H-like nuclease
MPTICGVDGCQAGWIALTLETQSRKIEPKRFTTFAELVNARATSTIIAIDIPIGLPDQGHRLCDQQARQLLGCPRCRSVFRAPIRAMLSACTHAEACRIGRSIDGKGLSVQTWGIMPKIREVDQRLRKDDALRNRVREVHPEVCFYHLAGRQPMTSSKKHAAGQKERQALLEGVFGDATGHVLARRRELHSAVDDILDAFAALWTAERIVSKQFFTLPPNPPLDAFGLRMEISA